MVETMRWPNASPSVLSIVDGKMPKLEAAIAIDRDVEQRPGILLVGRDIGDAAEGLQLVEKDRRPVIELVLVGVGQRVLILGLGEPRADGDVLRRLHVERDALDLLQCRLQAVDDLIGAALRWLCGFSAMNTRPWFSVAVAPPGPMLAPTEATAGSFSTGRSRPPCGRPSPGRRCPAPPRQCR